MQLDGAKIIKELSVLSEKCEEINFRDVQKHIVNAIKNIHSDKPGSDICDKLISATNETKNNRLVNLAWYNYKPNPSVQAKRPGVINKSKKDVTLSPEEKKLQGYALAKIAGADLLSKLEIDHVIGTNNGDALDRLVEHLKQADVTCNYSAELKAPTKIVVSQDLMSKLHEGWISAQPQQLRDIAGVNDNSCYGDDSKIRNARTVIKKLLRVASKTTNVDDKQSIAKVALQEYIAVTKKRVKYGKISDFGKFNAQQKLDAAENCLKQLDGNHTVQLSAEDERALSDGLLKKIVDTINDAKPEQAASHAAGMGR